MINVLAGIAGQVIGLFGAKGRAQQERMMARVAAMERSWTDEVIALYWFSPGFVAWFSPERATEWIAAVSSQPEFFATQGIITAAVFGLGKINGRREQKK